MGSTEDMEIGQESGMSVTRTVFGCEQFSKDKKKLSMDVITSMSHCSRDTSHTTVGAVKTECPSIPNTSVSNSSTCRDNSLLRGAGVNSSLFLHQTPPLLHRGDESCDRRTHSSCNGATFRSISSILSTPDSSLQPTDMSMMSPSFSDSPHTLTASTPISLSNYVEPGSWFSVLPRTSCDPTEKSPSGGATSAVPACSSRCLKSSTALSDSLSTFHLRQSNASQESSGLFNSVHNMTAGSDVNALMLQCVTGDVISDASQIAAQVEAMLVRDQVQYVDSKPIPESAYQLSLFCWL